MTSWYLSINKHPGKFENLYLYQGSKVTLPSYKKKALNFINIKNVQTCADVLLYVI
jgi:hypothetical protein